MYLNMSKHVLTCESPRTINKCCSRESYTNTTVTIVA